MLDRFQYWLPELCYRIFKTIYSLDLRLMFLSCNQEYWIGLH
jgi:hypothetical protein